jgi:HK97 family phage major capsid protein
MSREDVSTLIQQEYGPTIIGFSAAGSATLAAARAAGRLVPMGTKVRNMPIATALPTAGWVTESVTTSSGTKPTSKIRWENRQLVAEEVAVILPIHENVVADATEDVLLPMAQMGGQALAVKLDRAVLFGLEKPSSWTSPGLLPAAIAAGQTTQVSVTPGEDDLWGSFNLAAGELAEDGHDPGRAFAPRGIGFRMRNLRNADGSVLLTNVGTDDINGIPTSWVQAADGDGPTWDRSLAEAILIDPSRFVMGLRSDIKVKILTEATITVGGESINLAEKDMLGLRLTARYAYVLGTGITNEGVSTVPVHAVVPA